MKNNTLRNRDVGDGKKTTFNLSGTQMCLIGLLCVILNVISEKFGTYPHYSSGRYSHMEILGIIFPLAVLIIPLFYKKSRESLWTKKNIIINHYWNTPKGEFIFNYSVNICIYIINNHRIYSII